MKNLCPICGKHIIGRSDKKFCSTKCKNNYHHPSKNLKGDHIKMVNNFLYQNFKIMESIFSDEKKNKLMVPRILLDKMGFHYSYSTGCYINKQKKLYRYIYNYAWMEFSNQKIMLLKLEQNLVKY
jgi:predicted nucleic acid-binding Zn ribbon protein